MTVKFHRKVKANFVSKLTLWWIVDLLWKGNKNPLNLNDLYHVDKEDRAERRSGRLGKIWRDEKTFANQKQRKPKLWKAMIRYITWKEYGVVSFWCFSAVSGAVFFRYLVLKLMEAVNDNIANDMRSKYACIVYLWGMIIASLVGSFSMRHFNLNTSLLGIKSRAAVLGLIYQKVLKCSKTTLNPGKVLELICNDTQRLALMADRSILYLFRKSMAAFLYTCWLFLVLGWKIIPGLLVSIFLAIIRISIAKSDVKLRQSASEVGENRLSYLREFLTIILTVKLNGLEHIYRSKIQATRWEEIKFKAKRWTIFSIFVSFSVCGQLLSTFVTIVILIFTDTTMLTFSFVFTTILLSQSISDAILMEIPVSIHFTTDILTALSRIQHFLERSDDLDPIMNVNRSNHIGRPELEESSAKEKQASLKACCTPYIWLENYSRKVAHQDTHCQENSTFQLQNISFKIETDGLVIITGSVGSGKSSLLISILDGDLAIKEGSLKHSGSIAYVSDTPWAFPGTIRENILFGSAFNEQWYLETIRACQLERDFRTFPEQDLSRIGEHGATLSGGQRTRIALARAVYSRADIYLLDDPLSSLDPKVADFIFKTVLKGLLSKRIVVMVSRKYSNEADFIVKLDKGTVVAQGTVDEVNQLQGINTTNKVDQVMMQTDDESQHVERHDDLGNAEQLREAKEDRQIGNVSIKTYAKYFMHGAPTTFLALILLVIGAGKGLTTYIDFQVSSMPLLTEQKERLHQAFISYPLYLIPAVFVTMLSYSCICLLPIRASYNIHGKMITRLLRAPIHFFAVNPAGRILNRFSQDINNLEDLLPYNMMYFFKTMALSLTAIVLCVMTNISLLLPVLVTIIMCFAVSRFFFKPVMDIKRLMSEASGPLYSHFSNTLEGLRIIRVHNRQKEFIKVLFSLTDRHHQCMFAYYTAARWFGLVMDCILLIFLIAIVITVFVTVKDSSTAVIASLAIMYSSQSLTYVAAAVRSAVEVQSQMTSAERILAYTEIKPEKGDEIQEEPRKEWPEFGKIQFKDVFFRYYENGPAVLKALSFQINGSEKIGVVGRTGAGKSSIVAALMRIGEIEGSIFIDNADIAYFNLQSTRTRISVVSQSPVLFNGTIRENLDPTGKFDDSEIWKVLNQMQLGILVESLPNKLDNICTGSGSNFSIGQRQLFHLAKVLLKRNSIIVFDEASGKVDKKTAEQIHEVVYNMFKGCTMIIISHRMATVKKCDRIMVLDHGAIVEFDKPNVLLDKNGFFAELARISEEKSNENLTKMDQ
ncbi:multidrug resistance-associated protein 4-like [Dendronephthya gigantea]|uniref:multidrug resistance-associated protein 4-like n=1 Tax=Dendronephthya gigantea TaxID=151771 RepID=UPI001068D842|nr:multidrug resistance-associated protein 4-like [Dendronephthya gigantea]